MISGNTEENIVVLLNQAIEFCYKNVNFYNKLLSDYLPPPVNINGLEQFESLPYTTKEDVKNNFPYGMAGVPVEEIIAYYESSGTTGSDYDRSTKIPSFLTQLDLDNDIKRRLMNAVSVTNKDIVLNALPYVYTSCGLAFHRAYQSQGAMMLACGNVCTSSAINKQINISSYLKPTILLSAYPVIYKMLAQNNLNAEIENFFSRIKTVILCGIATSYKGREKISCLFNNADVCDVYGLSEFGAITAFCLKGKKHIVNKDFYVEIIDPTSLKKIENNKAGEIVITTLTRQGSPKLRYRTGDIGLLTTGFCGCGNSAPILEIIGREADAIIINEKKIFPYDIEEAICSVEESNGIFKATLMASNKISVEIEVDTDKNFRRIEKKAEEVFFKNTGVGMDAFCRKTGDLHINSLWQNSNFSFKKIKSFQFL